MDQPIAESSSKTNEIEYVQISPADNGWIVSWSERKVSYASSKFGDVKYEEGKRVFTKEQTDEAFDLHKELKMKEEV